MPDILDQIDARIKELKAELSELEIAAKVNRQMMTMMARSQKPPISATKESGPEEIDPRLPDMSGLTVMEAAKAVLGIDSIEPMHYKDVHSFAVRCGYHSDRKNATNSAVSFWSTMKRNPDVFDAMGGGIFKLK